jgi:hypothetical protein
LTITRKLPQGPIHKELAKENKIKHKANKKAQPKQSRENNKKRLKGML